VILLYHRIATLGHDVHGLALTAGVFRDQLARMRERWTPLPLAELAKAIRDGDPPERAVALTFDDGYLDNLERAQPLLAALDMPATFFLTSERPETRRAFWWDVLERIVLQQPDLPARMRVRVAGEPIDLATGDREERLAAHWRLHAVLRDSLPAVRDALLRDLAREASARLDPIGDGRPMTAPEMRAAAAAPRITIGAHGVHHVSLTRLSRDDRYREVFDSRAEIERIVGRQVTSFAYPFGDLSPEVIDTVRAGGFELAVSCEERAVRARDALFSLPRWSAPPIAGEAFERWLEQASEPRS
jgi:peptidoglycan/xylan/chitin deacetylase (PgdA/CDA1 family)